MDVRLRDRLALAIALVAVAAGMGAFLVARDTGMRLEVEGDGLVVDEVALRSPADVNGVRPGLDVASRAELATRALREGWLEILPAR
jgi:hypothetical protein